MYRIKNTLVASKHFFGTNYDSFCDCRVAFFPGPLARATTTVLLRKPKGRCLNCHGNTLAPFRDRGFDSIFLGQRRVEP